VALDLVVPGASARLVAELSARGIDVGLVVHNAGLGVGRPFAEADPEALVRQVDLHCRVPVELTKALLPALVARGGGGVIIVASVAGYLATSSGSVYGASKAFDLHLGEGLWAELRPLGIDVLAVSPGYTRTEFHAAAGIDPSSVPAWAWSRADDVAKTALERLGRDPSVVVGRGYRALAVLLRLVPRGLLNRLSDAIFFRKLAARRADDRGNRDGGVRPSGGGLER